jgi:hypothetical protein
MLENTLSWKSNFLSQTINEDLKDSASNATSISNHTYFNLRLLIVRDFQSPGLVLQFAPAWQLTVKFTIIYKFETYSQFSLDTEE